MSEWLVLQDVDVWYDSTKIHTTPHNNMTELYFEDNDIEGIIEKKANAIPLALDGGLR